MIATIPFRPVTNAQRLGEAFGLIEKIECLHNLEYAERYEESFSRKSS